MRLICPNCDAEYQVDDAAIPDAGRDVQCSNCGHAWFQLPAGAELARDAENALFGEDPSDGPSDVPVQTFATDTSEAVADSVSQFDAAAVDPMARPAGTRQTLAESVLSVLREEAARETTVRRETDVAQASGSVETQPDLGLEDVPQASAAARHIARLKGTEPEGLGDVEPKAAARRDLLPDIEEITSTLRANADRAKEEDAEIDALPDLRPRRGGFRSGFVLVMVASVALAMTYIMAPKIMAQMPGAAPGLRAYVATVDQGRLWLDGVMQSASGSLRSFSSTDN